MKITLDIDPNSLSSEVSEFVGQLTDKDKHEIVKQVVSQYYSDYRRFEDSEFADKEKEIIDRIRSKASSYDRDRFDTDEKVRNHYQFTEEKNKFKTLTQITREEISNSIRLQLALKINEFVSNDEMYQNMVKEAMETVRNAFPAMIQQAMIQHMIGQMPNLQKEMYDISSNMMNRIGDVEQKLLR